MAQPDYAPLFEWVRKREAIRVRRAAGAPPPYTDDPILANYRFCNVRREDDTVTAWIRTNIREPFADHPLLWFMLCVARQINWPETLADLIASPRAWPTGNMFDLQAMEDAIAARFASGAKTWTGAYVIAAGKAGVAKHVHVVRNVLAPLYEDRMLFARHFQLPPQRLQATHALLASYDGWGDFMAYQSIVDMRFTGLLNGALDVAAWAAAGPGTLRGLNRLHGRKLEARIDQGQALLEMRAIDAVVRRETGVEMDFSDIPNILCETDKFLRARNGEGSPRSKWEPLAPPTPKSAAQTELFGPA
jgi:hypothetical protein